MSLGILLALSAALGFGSSAVFARLGLQYMRSATGTIVSLLVGLVITLSLAFIFNYDDIVMLSGIAFAWFALAGVINFLFGRYLNFVSVNLAGVSKAAPIVGANPLFATALAITLGGETINAPILIGTFSIIGGLALILSQK